MKKEYFLKIEYNISRLKYLMSLYKMTIDELISLISKGLKSPISKDELLANEINISYLKKIDKIFNKGLHFYFDPKSPEITKDASIFFRKSVFNGELNIGARKIVNQFEEFKISLSAIAKLSEINLNRDFPVYTISQNPIDIAKELRSFLYPVFTSDKKEFLKLLINKLAEYNIFVFEFVETWNKKDKANIDGFFLNPNVIVLKRQQSSFRREIFTLIHELGHYLLDEEEIEELQLQNLANFKINAIEKWCNDFAYFFLIGEDFKQIDNLDNANAKNDYHHDLIKDISNRTHLSQIALFTRLLFQNKISNSNYNLIKSDFEERFRLKEEKNKLEKEQQKALGIKQGGSVPIPINSPLLISTLQTAFYEGIINEYDICKKLNIKPDKLNTIIQ